MNEMTPFQSDRFSPEEYLIALDGDDEVSNF